VVGPEEQPSNAEIITAEKMLKMLKRRIFRRFVNPISGE
jgi:hypothetical protein